MALLPVVPPELMSPTTHGEVLMEQNDRQLARGRLARMPLADPGGLQQLELPGPGLAALDRRVRACDRLTRTASEHKVRIKDLVRQLMPMTPLTGDLGKADLAVLERFADPRLLLAAGAAELTR